MTHTVEIDAKGMAYLETIPWHWFYGAIHCYQQNREIRSIAEHAIANSLIDDNKTFASEILNGTNFNGSVAAVLQADSYLSFDNKTKVLSYIYKQIDETGYEETVVDEWWVDGRVLKRLRYCDDFAIAMAFNLDDIKLVDIYQMNYIREAFMDAEDRWQFVVDEKDNIRGSYNIFTSSRIYDNLVAYTGNGKADVYDEYGSIGNSDYTRRLERTDGHLCTVTHTSQPDSNYRFMFETRLINYYDDLVVSVSEISKRVLLDKSFIYKELDGKMVLDKVETIHRVRLRTPDEDEDYPPTFKTIEYIYETIDGALYIKEKKEYATGTS